MFLRDPFQVSLPIKSVRRQPVLRALCAATLFVSPFISIAHADSFPAVINLGTLNSGTGLRVDGVAEADIAGNSVHAAGDVNQDGIDDLIIGAVAADPNGGQSGSSFVVFGKNAAFPAAFGLSALNGSNGFRINGVAANDRSGEMVGGVGDINHDGIDDVIISADRTDPNGENSGGAYVVFGRNSGFATPLELSSLNGSNGLRLDGVTALDHAGSVVGAAGDVNGDGIDDLLVSAEFASPNGAESGSVYVVFGKSTGFPAALNLASLNGSNGFRLDGVAALDSAGVAADGAGDVNHDGVDDLIIGAIGADPHGGGSGSVYVVYGHTGVFFASFNLAGLNGSNGFRLDGAVTGDNAGVAVARAGDVNHDGIDDMIIGASGADLGGSLSGSAYVVFGSSTAVSAARDLSSLNGSTGFRVNGLSSGDFLGNAVNAAGDINHDGIDDVVIGAEGADINGGASGSAYLVFGKSTGFTAIVSLSTLNGNNGIRLDGPTAGETAGLSVSAAGDINHDGIDDLLVGAPGASSAGISLAGSAYVVFGRDTDKLFASGFE